MIRSRIAPASGRPGPIHRFDCVLCGETGDFIRLGETDSVTHNCGRNGGGSSWTIWRGR